MMKKLLIGFAMVQMVFAAYSQNTSDIIFLKDGIIYRGEVLEYQPGEFALFRKPTGETTKIDFQNIERIKLNGEALSGFNMQPSKGLYTTVDLGLNTNWSTNYYYGNVAGGFLAAFGMRVLPKLETGLGLGLEGWGNQVLTPVLADLRYHITRKALSPFLQLRCGYAVPMNNYKVNGIYALRGGVTGSSHLGIKAQVSDQLSFMMSVGYRYLRTLSYEYYWWFSEGDLARIIGHYHRFEVRFGIGFNQ
ncbi:MAG: hypothetical protein Kow0075_00470 [Salibacteraceae bacterium]